MHAGAGAQPPAAPSDPSGRPASPRFVIRSPLALDAALKPLPGGRRAEVESLAHRWRRRLAALGQAPVSRYGLWIALQRAGVEGLSRQEIRGLFPEGVKASRIDALLQGLAARGLARREGERWVAQ